MKKIFMACTLVAAVFAGSAQADLSSYSQDFEAMATAASNAGNADLSADGWQINGIAWLGDVDDASTFQYFYGNFPANNADGAQFSGIVDAQGGATQGNRHLNVFSDYNNADAHANATSWVETRIFQEQTIGAPDVGQTYSLNFDYKRNFENGTDDFGPSGSTEAFAFVRVLDSIGGSFATIEEQTFETTGAALSAWNNGTVNFTIDAAYDGQLLQFGMKTHAEDFNGSGVLYDNVGFNVSAVPEPTSAAVIGLGLVGMFFRRRKA